MSEEYIALVRRIDALERALNRLLTMQGSKYKGTSAIDFTTTTLPSHGDYGYQTTDSELHFNCNGVIRGIVI